MIIQNTKTIKLACLDLCSFEWGKTPLYGFNVYVQLGNPPHPKSLSLFGRFGSNSPVLTCKLQNQTVCVGIDQHYNGGMH